MITLFIVNPALLHKIQVTENKSLSGLVPIHVLLPWHVHDGHGKIHPHRVHVGKPQESWKKSSMLSFYFVFSTQYSPKNTNRCRTPNHERGSVFSQDSDSITIFLIFFKECFVVIFNDREVIFDHKKTSFSNLVVWTHRLQYTPPGFNFI